MVNIYGKNIRLNLKHLIVLLPSSKRRDMKQLFFLFQIVYQKGENFLHKINGNTTILVSLYRTDE